MQKHHDFNSFLIFIFISLLFSCNLYAKKTDSSAAESSPAPTFDTAKAVVDSGSKDFGTATNVELVKAMTLGWNLGNTLDATGTNTLASETSWSQPLTTKKMIDGLYASGIRTIRIPISWHNHLVDKKYTLDPNWMNRVKEIVDWAISDGMYVIINSHHDNADFIANAITYGKGYYPLQKDKVESEQFLINIWSQISLAFNNGYDEHLVFETMNEPRLKDNKNGHEWWFDPYSDECKEAISCLNEYNQLCLDTIRASGGNNEKRFVMVPSLCASPDAAFSDQFKLPADKNTGRLILSIHMYTPYPFAMSSSSDKMDTTFTDTHKSQLIDYFNKINAKFISKGIPAVIGETGVTNKDNLTDRENWYTFFISKSRAIGITSCIWDNGVYELTTTDTSEHYGMYNRTEQTWYFPTLLAAAIAAE